MTCCMPWRWVARSGIADLIALGPKPSTLVGHGHSTAAAASVIRTFVAAARFIEIALKARNIFSKALVSHDFVTSLPHFGLLQLNGHLKDYGTDG